MRTINVKLVKELTEKLFCQANFELPEDIKQAIIEAKSSESSPQAIEILNQILFNADIAEKERLPLCQDCGVAVVFLEIGQDVIFKGGDLKTAINSGVKKVYSEKYLRKSIVQSPILRKNTNDNTPAIIHFDFIPGDKVKLSVMPKGGGCENMSRLAMLTPKDGIKGIKHFIIETVYDSGANPCPPIIVGVGLGGNFEYSAYLAKKSLFRKIGTPNPDKRLNELENELLEAINSLGFGPQGMGGKTTALAVNILEVPCHIASLPVAVNIECHSHRFKEGYI